MGQVIKRGMIQSFDNSTYTASVLIMEATAAFLTDVPVAAAHDGTSTLTQSYCAVLFFDEHNYTDAVIIAVYPNSTQGVPANPPGRLTFVSGAQQVNGAVINSGVTTAFQISGNGGIPAGALGIVYKAFFSSPTVGAFIQIAPHGGSIANYQSIGNLTVAGESRNGNGIVQLDSTGQIDIKANSGNCTVNLFTHGYII